jgi:hypothetical protein
LTSGVRIMFGGGTGHLAAPRYRRPNEFRQNPLGHRPGCPAELTRRFRAAGPRPQTRLLPPCLVAQLTPQHRMIHHTGNPSWGDRFQAGVEATPLQPESGDVHGEKAVEVNRPLGVAHGLVQAVGEVNRFRLIGPRAVVRVLAYGAAPKVRVTGDKPVLADLGEVSSLSSVEQHRWRPGLAICGQDQLDSPLSRASASAWANRRSPAWIACKASGSAHRPQQYDSPPSGRNR